MIAVEKARTRCPICDRPDFCLIEADGSKAICMRVSDGGKPVDMGPLGEGWLHVLTEDVARPPDRPQAAAIPRPEPADRDTLHRAYSAILGRLSLSPAHRQDLRRRGLQDAQIDAIGLRTLPVRGRAKVAKDALGDVGGDLETALRVPGLFMKRSEDRAWLTLGGAPGLLVPSRDTHGRIFSLQVRRDEPGPGGARYQFLTSTGEERGNGPGPVQGAHVPRHKAPPEVLRLTEGPLKAEVSTHLSGVLTIAAPGVSAWRLFLPVLAELRPARVLVAFDADFQTNPHVARELRNLITAIREAA